MEQRITTPDTTVAGRLPASIPYRLLQGVVDLFVVVVAATASFWLVPDTGPAGSPVALTPWDGVHPVPFVLLLVLLPALTGRTIGMWLLGLRVRSVDDGGPAGFWQHVFRGLVLPIDLVFLGLVGIVSMLLGRRTQRLGDRLTGTVVEPVD